MSAIAAFTAGASTPAASSIVWSDGTPPPLRPDNPYLPALNSHVRRALHLQRTGKREEHPFYLVWGAAGAGSEHRDDPALRELALAEFDAATLERVEKPQAFWAIYADLEALLLWQLEGEVPAARIVTWQDRLRPSIEANIEAITGDSWVTVAANTLLQSAAILQLAVTSYGRIDPADPGLPRWRAQARENIERARAIQLPGGAFSYIRDSGPDPCYFAFDTAHLGRYYQLTGEPRVRESLVRMAEWAGAATRCGWLTPFSSPWWKHIVGTGGPYTGPETVTTLADDPLMRGVMAKRRGFMQPYVWTYANMYGWTPADGPVEPIGDRCAFDRNANGPALRRGGFDVEMPARAWGDSTCGMLIATERQFSSCVNAVYLAANEGNEDPGKRSARHAWTMLGEDAMDSQAHLVGDGWIAATNTFAVHRGVYGDIPPAASPWQRSDFWYADEDGVVGLLELRCMEDVEARGIELWVSTPAKTPRLERAAVVFPDFSLFAGGCDVGAGTVAEGPTTIAWFPVDGTGQRRYEPGERFGAAVSLRRPGRPILTIEVVESGTPATQLIEIRQNGLPYRRFARNTTGSPVRHRGARIPAYGLLTSE